MSHIKKLMIIVFIITAIIAVSHNHNLQQEYAKDLIRFHVIPNSDAIGDQMLKLDIRDAVVSEMKDRFAEIESKEDAMLITINSLDEIKTIAEEQIAQQGQDYKVEVMLGDYQFPTRKYGDITLPQGKYQAVRLVIGEGEGQNWWCVLFPPLCFLEGVQTIPEGQQAKGVKVFEKDDIEFRLRSLEFLNRK